MYQILVGFVFISMNFYINFGYSAIGLIPDFVGYFLIGRALYELEDEATHFRAAKGSVKIMTVVSIVAYILDLTGIIKYSPFSRILIEVTGVLNMAIGFGCLVMYAYITYLITLGVQEMEGEYNEDMNGTGLMTAWKWMIGAKALNYCMVIIGAFLPDVSVVTSLLVLITLVLYFVQFYKCARRY